MRRPPQRARAPSRRSQRCHQSQRAQGCFRAASTLLPCLQRSGCSGCSGFPASRLPLPGPPPSEIYCQKRNAARPEARPHLPLQSTPRTQPPHARTHRTPHLTLGSVKVPLSPPHYLRLRHCHCHRKHHHRCPSTRLSLIPSPPLVSRKCQAAPWPPCPLADGQGDPPRRVACWTRCSLNLTLILTARTQSCTHRASFHPGPFAPSNQSVKGPKTSAAARLAPGELWMGECMAQSREPSTIPPCR
ncbi:hypothetical protein ANO11243_039530 [Dothideomycetidae sp. 11243]|nr:hypothetical protein ANO11243_039530 [fungal sp. No.11243]